MPLTVIKPDSASNLSARDDINRARIVRHQKLCAEIVRLFPGKTAGELAKQFESQLIHMGCFTVMRRMTEIMGRYVQTGERRKCSVFGERMVTYYPIFPSNSLA